MILRLTKRVLSGHDRNIRDSRSGLKVTKTREHLIIYRNGEMKLWLDLELKYVVSFHVNTQAEVSAFNRVLALVEMSNHYEFTRTGRVVILKTGDQFYRAEAYNEKFGPDSGNYRTQRPSSSAE